MMVGDRNMKREKRGISFTWYVVVLMVALVWSGCSEVISTVEDGDSSSKGVAEEKSSDSESSEETKDSNARPDEQSSEVDITVSSDNTENDQSSSAPVVRESATADSSEEDESSEESAGDESSDDSDNQGSDDEGLLRSENREREILPGKTLLSTDDWRDSTRYIFHPDSVYTYELNIGEQDLAFLDEEPQREEYVPGSLSFQGNTLENVAVRYKGSKGAWTPCGEKTKICKLSMKVKINTDTDPDRQFYGLKKLQFHSMNHSQSHLSEHFAYWAYREMDVAASRTSYVRLLINGKLEGLFLMVEQVDGRFTRYHLNDDEGNVYKHYWPLEEDQFSTGATLTEALKTNEEEADHSVVEAFEEDLDAAGTKKGALTDFLNKWEMSDQIARQVVTATAVYDWDGPYMGAWDNGHNTYWAVLPKSEKIIMIPWDMDMPEFADFMRGLVTGYTLWNGTGKTGGYPGCPDGTTSRFTKVWFCFPKEYAVAFDDLEERVLARRSEILEKWTEQIRPVMEEIAETMPTGNASTWPDQGGYPWKALTIKNWEAAIENYHAILDGLEGSLKDMKQSLGM